MVVGTLVFAAEALYFSLSRLLHYHTPTTRLTGSLGFAVLLFSFGYVAMQIVQVSERRLLSIENELAIAREIQASILPGDNPKMKNLRVAAAYHPMTDVAGDFYEFVPVDELGAYLAATTSPSAALMIRMRRLSDRFAKAGAGQPPRQPSQQPPHQPRQQPSGPSRPAAQIEHSLSGTQVHQADSFLRDIKVMAFHLLAFALLGPAVEFVLQALVGRNGFV